MVSGGSLYLTETFIMAMLKLATQGTALVSQGPARTSNSDKGRPPGSTGDPHQPNEVIMSRFGLLDTAATVLARVIQLNCDLVKVDFSGNHLTDHGAHQIMSAFRDREAGEVGKNAGQTNHVLREINFADNELDNR